MQAINGFFLDDGFEEVILFYILEHFIEVVWRIGQIDADGFLCLDRAGSLLRSACRCRHWKFSAGVGLCKYGQREEGKRDGIKVMRRGA